MTPPLPVAELVPVRGSTAVVVPVPSVTLRHDDVAVFADLAKLVRPRIVVMVLATVVAAAWLTAGRPADPAALAWLLVGTALVAASSSVANQILERDTDRLMRRTAGRPLAAGRLTVSAAWLLAVVALVAGTAVCWLASGWQPAAAALATWLLYVVAYTPLKRITPLNTAVGAVAGVLPVAIGWLAADGPARLSAGDARGALAAAALATVLYLWQFPHFMAIAWLYRQQYAAAGARMLTVVDPSGLRAAGQSLTAALALVPAALVLAVPSGSVRMFLSAAVAAVVYLLATVRFAVRRDDAAARFLLLSSLGALLGLLSAAVVFGGPA
ncbi:MAG: protoheme IX farnesyltransferase [Planctomycetes bacterium]|nr:protoheme IX farnesyltransferase [Planctomycetota bacterium]